jgi:hypothetical protein
MRALLSFATVVILPSLILATSPATCPSTENSYQEEKLFFLYRTFCNKLSTQSFTPQLSFTGSATDPWVSFGFEPAGQACSEDICAKDYGDLISTCKSLFMFNPDM